MKTCTRCGLTKPLAAFGRSREKQDGLRNHCALCESRKSAAYYLVHVEERKAYSRRYRAYCQEQRKLRQAQPGVGRECKR